MTKNVPASMLVLTGDGQLQHWKMELDEIEPHRSYVLRVLSPHGQPWSSDGFGVWDCLMRLRRQLEPLGYRLCCNGARRGVWISGMLADWSAGYDVYVLDDRVEGQPPPIVSTLDAASPELVVSVDEQRQLFAALSGWALDKIPYGPSATP